MGIERFTVSLAACRVNANLSQKELANIMDVSSMTVINWEKGETEPTFSQIKKISELSKIPVDFIRCAK